MKAFLCGLLCLLGVSLPAAPPPIQYNPATTNKVPPYDASGSASAVAAARPTFTQTTNIATTVAQSVIATNPIPGFGITRDPSKIRSQDKPPMGYFMWYLEPLTPDRPDWGDITNLVQMYKTNKLDALGWKYLLFDDTYTSGNWYFSNNWIFSTNIPPIDVVLDYIHTNGLKAGTWIDCDGAYPGDPAVSNMVYMGFDYIHLDFDYESPNSRYKHAASIIYSNTFNPPLIHAAVDAHNASNWSPDVFDYAQVVQLLPHALDQTDTILSYYEFLVTASQARSYLKPGQYLWPCAPLLYPAGAYCSTNYPLAMGIACMMNGPLELGVFDIPGIADPFWKNLVCQPQSLGTTTNRMLLSIDQDPLQIPAFIVWDRDNVICLAKPLVDGRMAVAAFHHVKDEGDKTVTINFQDVGMPDSCIVQEVIPQASWGTLSTSLSTNIPAGQMPIWILTPADGPARTKQIVGTFSGDGSGLTNVSGTGGGAPWATVVSVTGSATVTTNSANGTNNYTIDVSGTGGDVLAAGNTTFTGNNIFGGAATSNTFTHVVSFGGAVTFSNRVDITGALTTPTINGNVVFGGTSNTLTGSLAVGVELSVSNNAYVTGTLTAGGATLGTGVPVFKTASWGAFATNGAAASKTFVNILTNGVIQPDWGLQITHAADSNSIVMNGANATIMGYNDSSQQFWFLGQPTFDGSAVTNIGGNMVNIDFAGMAGTNASKVTFNPSATNLIDVAFYPTNLCNPEIPNPTLNRGAGLSITNNDIAIAGLGGLRPGQRAIWSHSWSNSAAGNITIAAPPNSFPQGSVSTNSQVVTQGKWVDWTFDAILNVRTNYYNAGSQ